MTLNWYVLHSKPNKEQMLCDQLLSNELEAYCPSVPVQTVNPRARRSRPYFPGYVFVRLDPRNTRMSSLDWLPGATGFVSFDKQPADLPDSLVQSIRRRVEEIRAAGGELMLRLRPGQAVTITDGPFAGYNAIFDARLSASDRVRVLLTVLRNRQMPLELAAGQIQAGAH
jgi:transcription antitermination factor NusG